MLKFEGWKTKVTIPRLFWLDESSAQAFCCFSFRMGGGGRSCIFVAQMMQN